MADEIVILCHFDGKIVMNGNGPNYDRGVMRPMFISKSVSYNDLLLKSYEITGWEIEMYEVVMKCRFPTYAPNQCVCLNVNDDNSTKAMLGLFPRVFSVELYLEKVLSTIPRSGSLEVDSQFHPICNMQYQRGRLAQMLDDDDLSLSLSSHNVHGRCKIESTFPPPRNMASQEVLNLGTTVRRDEVGPSQSQNFENFDGFHMGNTREYEDVDIFINEEYGNRMVEDGLLNVACAVNAEGDDIIDCAVANNNEDGGFFEEFLEELTNDEWIDDAVANDTLHGFILESQSVHDELCVGQTFPHKQALKHALQDYSIQRHVEYKVTKSNATQLTAKCVQDGCGWRIHSSAKVGLPEFKIKTIGVEHTCMNDMLNKDHRQCTPTFICKIIMPTIKEKMTMTPVDIQGRIKNTFHLDISYSKAWRARQMAIKAIFGDWNESYALVPKFLNAIIDSNSGSVYKLQCAEAGHCRRFVRLFWAFGPSIQGFKYCRPVISVDGTHLLGKYPGQLLIATAIDGNYGLFPLAFGIVESENAQSWGWFLHHLRYHVTLQRTDLTIISDRHRGLKEAVPHIFPSPDYQHRFCMRHIADNFKREFKNDTLVNLIWSASKKLWLDEFEATMELIKGQNEIAKWKLSCPELKLEQWSFVHDGNKRWGLMTTNMSESFNSVLKGARGLPIQALVATTYFRLNKFFVKRRSDGLLFSTNVTNSCTPTVEQMLAKNIDEARQHRVIQFSTELFLVHTVNKRNVTVDLNNRTCECGEFQMLRMPCSHALAVCRHQNIQPRVYCSPYYTVETYRMLYAPIFRPYRDSSSWTDTGLPVTPPLSCVRFELGSSSTASPSQVEAEIVQPIAEPHLDSDTDGVLAIHSDGGTEPESEIDIDTVASRGRRGRGRPPSRGRWGRGRGRGRGATAI